MSDEVVRRRRHPEAVVGAAVVVGLVTAIPVALLVLLAPVFVQALRDGATFPQALSATWITDSEDWEMLPLFLLGALVAAALISAAAAGAWYLVAARAPGRPWVARLAAVTVAAGAPLLLLAMVAGWTSAAPAAVVTGSIALVAAPRVGFARARRSTGPVG